MAKIILPKPPQWAPRTTLQQVMDDVTRWMGEVKRRVDDFEVWGKEHQGLAMMLTADEIPYQTAAPSDSPPDGTVRLVKTGGVYYLYGRVDGTWKRVVIA